MTDMLSKVTTPSATLNRQDDDDAPARGGYCGFELRVAMGARAFRSSPGRGHPRSPASDPASQRSEATSWCFDPFPFQSSDLLRHNLRIGGGSSA